MVNDDVLFGFRLRLFSLAEELGNVREGVPDLQRGARPHRSADRRPDSARGPCRGPQDEAQMIAMCRYNSGAVHTRARRHPCALP